MAKRFDKKYGHNLHKQDEKILCSAIWYKDLGAQEDLDEELAQVLEEQRLPINCDRGTVFCGHRHGQAMRTMNSITGLKDYEAGESVQGFLTNYNRFVDRIEGAEIAWKAGQIPKKLDREMFSEDLY